VVKILDRAIKLLFNVFRDNEISVPHPNYPAQQQIHQNIITVLPNPSKNTVREFEGSTKGVFPNPEVVTNLTQ
jgi:hypothetical protein